MLGQTSTFEREHEGTRCGPQGRLANFIDNIVIPGPLIHGIVQGEVNEEWLGHLEDLHNKLEFVRQSKIVQVLSFTCSSSIGWSDCRSRMLHGRSQALGGQCPESFGRWRRSCRPLHYNGLYIVTLVGLPPGVGSAPGCGWTDCNGERVQPNSHS